MAVVFFVPALWASSVAQKTTLLLSIATSHIPPTAFYSSTAAAITATMITMAPTTNQFLLLVRACAVR